MATTLSYKTTTTADKETGFLFSPLKEGNKIKTQSVTRKERNTSKSQCSSPTRTVAQPSQCVPGPPRDRERSIDRRGDGGGGG